MSFYQYLAEILSIISRSIKSDLLESHKYFITIILKYLIIS